MSTSPARTIASPTLRQRIAARRDELIPLAIVFVVAVAVLTAFRREPVYSDDLTYWERWSEITRTRGTANPYRLTMVLSAQAARLVFGESMAAYNAVGIAYGAGLVAVVYLLARLLFARTAGFVAAGLLLTSPLFLQDVTLLLPDWPSMFWFAAGLFLLAYAALRLSDDRRATLIAALAAGACLYLSILAREATAPLLIAVPLALLAIAPARRAMRLTGWAVVSFTALWIVEMAVHWVIYDHPFRRLMVVLGGHVARRTSEALGGRVPVQPRADDGDNGASGSSGPTWGDLADRYLDPIMGIPSAAILLGLAAFAIIVMLAARNRRLLFLAIPAVIGLGYIMFGVGSIRPLSPILSMKFRYLSTGWVFLPPLAAGAMWIVGHAIRQRVNRWRAVPRHITRTTTGLLLAAVVAAPLALGVHDAITRTEFVRAGADGLRQTSEAVQRLQAAGVDIERIVADGRTLQGLQIQLPRDDKPLLENSSSNFARAQPGDLVVVNRKRLGEAGVPDRGDPLPEELLIPPPNWRHVGDAVHSDMFIYYVHEATGDERPDLVVDGEDIAYLARGSQLDGDDVEFGWQSGPSGVLVWMDEVDNVRVITGLGSHARPARPDEIDRMRITTAGRLGARVDMHYDRRVQIPSVWLRVFDEDGRQTQLLRMYKVEADGRTWEPGFQVNMERMTPVSFGGSLNVDPAVDHSFRIVVFASGSGVLTTDRIAIAQYETR